MLRRSNESLRSVGSYMPSKATRKTGKLGRLKRGLAGVAVVSGLGAISRVADATQYTLTLIPTGNIVASGPSINNDGTIAFAGAPVGGTPGIFTGIYTYSGGAVHTVTDSTGPLATFDGGTTINNNGVVAFKGSPLSGQTLGIYTASVGSAITPIAVQSVTNNIGFNGGWAMNDAGTVAFSGFSGGKAAILSGNGGALAVEATTGTTEGYKIFGGEVSINSSGVVAFTSLTNTAKFVATHAPGQVGTTTIASTTNQNSSYQYPSINDAGTVAYIDTYGYVFQPAFITHTTDGTSTYAVTTYPSGPSIGLGILNNNGQIIFEGGNYPQTGVIFDGPSKSDAVVNLSDFPGPVNFLSFGSDWVNDSGQAVIEYHLTDGTSGIALASPVPEPASLMGAAMGTLLLARRRRSC